MQPVTESGHPGNGFCVPFGMKTIISGGKTQTLKDAVCQRGQSSESQNPKIQQS
jgi:hypothetical protein